MAGIILVRHAMPEVVRGVSSTLWELGEAALEDCVLLAHALPHELAPAVFTSHQPKVKQTACVLALRRGLEVLEDERLREVGQGPAWIDDYRAAAARLLIGSRGSARWSDSPPVWMRQWPPTAARPGMW